MIFLEMFCLKVVAKIYQIVFIKKIYDFFFFWLGLDKDGQRLDKDWTKTGQRLDKDWTKTGQRLGMKKKKKFPCRDLNPGLLGESQLS
jgi:hypothetical protein